MNNTDDTITLTPATSAHTTFSTLDLSGLQNTLSTLELNCTLEDVINSQDTVWTTANAGQTWTTNPTGNITGGNLHPSYGAVPLSNITIGHASGVNTAPSWVTNTTGTNYTIGTMNTNPMSVGHQGTVSLKGEKADIDINGKSLVAWMEKVEERLNILTPNPELEKEWDQLRKLGERYRKLEQKCKEKSDMWNKLKNMPKPNINL